MLTPDQQRRHKAEGYVLIDPAIPDGMLERLRAAANRITVRTRSGDWPHHRSTGEDDIWGIGNLLHPEVGTRVFGEYMASPIVIEVVADLLVLAPSLQKRPYSLNW